MIVLRLLFLILCGWTIGVIINYLSDTLPVYRRLNYPSCNYCQNRNSLLAYYVGNKCHNCGKSRKIRFWIINVLISLVFIYESIVSTGNNEKLFSETIIFSLLILITVIDIEHHLVLNMVSLVGIFVFGIIGVITHGWITTLIGGVMGFVIMFLFFLLGQLYSRYISRKRGIEVEDGLGFGDVSLSAVCGLLLGWPGIIGGIFLSIIFGGLWSVGMILTNMIRKSENPLLKYIAYAPFITIATGALWLMR